MTRIMEIFRDLRQKEEFSKGKIVQAKIASDRRHVEVQICQERSGEIYFEEKIPLIGSSYINTDSS